MALDKNWIEAFGLIVSLAFLIIIGSSIRAQVVISSRVPDNERIYVIGPLDFRRL